MKQQLEEFYTWLRTSANGRDEQNAGNNHGTWYDAQAAHLALVLERTDDARDILTQGLSRRLASQVRPDGSQPQELGRTKSLYSLFHNESQGAADLRPAGRPSRSRLVGLRHARQTQPVCHRRLSCP